MPKEKNLIKIFEKETALVLIRRDFAYITEKISDEQDVYVFVNTEELRQVLTESYGLADALEDDTLRFS